MGHPIDDTPDTHAAWTAAAEQLIGDAAERTVEELRVQARAIRDQLDPEGAERRYLERYERRAFRIWTDADGIEHGRIEFEDDGAAWIRTIRDATLRPRRGGPRFVDAAEARQAADLSADARTNDQLSYDLLIDLLRAGALADAATVFGTRQAGVRIVTIVDDPGGATSARTEDYGHPIPTTAVDRKICETGTVTISIDRTGNPLDVGREHRLFTPRQRIALAIRDGGCRWKGCDRPASYCEAHHIDEWHRDGGRTDIDRGILLCRHHHVQLHHGGWRITRHGTDHFTLHPPGNRPAIPLMPRTALTAAWAGIDPPPPRFTPAA
ncbi:HNH endonuclease signature motif containing protein [Microbacterium esteraromaticum]|uniref:HNH endonuclease signature motif containing protein n=1 Tax=Microbacterium esteraromaticum TaxID=57043 RepID=UPI0021755A96|nr:HNH endonuclease signature motif containing protein [Microbacterium esteraromaticum]